MPRKKTTASGLPDSLNKVLHALSEKKVDDLMVVDVSKLAGYTDYFVIGTGNSAPHVQAMADNVAAALKKPHGKGLHLEGLQTGTWVLIDCGDFVVHLFQPEARKFYALEDLWGDAPRVEVGL